MKHTWDDGNGGTDMDARILRKARQLVSADRWLGMDFVPGSPRAATVQPPQTGRVPGTMAPPIDRHPVTGSSQPILVRSTLNREEKGAALAALAQEVAAWVESDWPRDGWNRLVFGEGDAEARLMFIGEGPGAEEDAQGRPFVGPAGRLLDKQIAAMGLAREQVYIANIAKTRPPGNRVPTPQEAEKWMPWLVRQIEIICPQVIVALGATSAKYLLNDPELKITRQRGVWCSFRGIDLMCTFHPAYLLRQYTTENRRRVWDDLQKVLERLGLEPPGRRGE